MPDLGVSCAVLDSDDYIIIHCALRERLTVEAKRGLSRGPPTKTFYVFTECSISGNGALGSRGERPWRLVPGD